MIAEDEDGRLIVIENQLERTNHGHLGQLVTYLSNLDARIAIWICTEARPEHLRAVEWLNEITPDDVGFYVLKLEAYRIEDSPPAPLFVKLAGPTSTGKEIGAARKELAGIQLLRKEFWEFLLGRARQKGVTLHSGVSPTTENWLGTGAGKSGLGFHYLVRIDQAPEVFLYIDTGDEAKNRQIFNFFFIGKKEEIEAAFGAPLIWHCREGVRSCRIRYVVDAGGIADRDRWPDIADAMIEAMSRLAQAFQPHIKALAD